jgi:hypothetical protein
MKVIPANSRYQNEMRWYGTSYGRRLRRNPARVMRALIACEYVGGLLGAMAGAIFFVFVLRRSEQSEPFMTAADAWQFLILAPFITMLTGVVAWWVTRMCLSGRFARAKADYSTVCLLLQRGDVTEMPSSVTESAMQSVAICRGNNKVEEKVAAHAALCAMPA